MAAGRKDELQTISTADRDGGYTQSGGGNHNQNSGDYNQSASSMVERGILDVVTLSKVLKSRNS
ncbi:hypothetical protein ENSA5_37230 [Enhygromyxa salina]|uniref:Uncharacterized protein n=1 Tax=Enhygromyxa salina TaxID=215803 RepID=A0A2S9XSK8_9BACT|nr:hypothetical protein [Enhygromyxa salina]PRP95854.1 hypothetical protein ENSA5_37230 [Enhygromyxa salina]